MAIATADQLETPRGHTPIITPRRGLPSGRALIGGLLVTVAALGSFAIATAGSEGPGTEYLVLSSPVAAGDTITLTTVAFEAMELSPSLIASALTTTDGLEGAIALRDLRIGELLAADDLIAAPSVDGQTISGMHELTFAVPLDRTPPGLRRGDRVTILGTATDTTTVAVEDALVLMIDTRPDQIGSSGRGVLTLAIEDAGSVMTITHVTQTAEITVVRSTRALDDIYPELVTSSETTP